MKNLIEKSDVLEAYADLYDIFDDNKAIQKELDKVFDKINNIPTVESSNSEKSNNYEVECKKCKHFKEEADTYMKQCKFYFMECHYEPKEKPQIDCRKCKHYTHCYINECTNYSHYEPKDEPQINEHITEDDAYYIVFKDLTKDEGLLTGKYDAKHGNKHYMYGINSVMEYIAYRVGEDCLDAFNEHFTNNMIKSEEAKEQNNE